ncbi:hypothetical protein BUALT_Bualt02G0026200 [Buddleja alternifolia]|uniref:TF-B3 domain-containing protein n=1 Tax=Buddleja alternifolia TaxID=168488 RepID=A0AAV6XWR9_9LAMI|nr:hypothetical protein BUALT_Bualt02G0026200 [Buddleja alternifolia]
MAGNRGDSLNFFKIMLGPTWQDEMTLPPLFVIGTNISCGDSLTAHSKMGTIVFRIEPTVDGLLALSRTEWHQFVSKHKIEETFLVLFIHQGNLNFNVTFYDHTACEHEYAIDDSDSEDTSDENTDDEDVIEVVDYAGGEGDDDVQQIHRFRITIPPSAAYNCRHYLLSRLIISSRAWMGFGLIDYHLAILKVPAVGSTTWQVRLAWISRFDQCGISMPRTFVMKVGWLEFANTNRIRAGDTCVFKVTEMVGNVVRMDVVIERARRVR